MLSAGDIAIVGLQADNPDIFAFVALGPIPLGTEIFFTDNGVFDDGSFRSTEGVLKWVAQSDIAAGTVITNSDAGFSSDSGSFALSASGDQVIAYQEDAGAVTFLYALQSNSTEFQTTATASTNSALPPGLVEGVTAIAAGSGAGAGSEFDNIWYTGPTSGSKEEILAAIGTLANWTGDNASTNFAVPTSFNVGTGPISDLIISEYIEGSSFNKAIELYNTTGSDLNLDGDDVYTLERYSNGRPVADGASSTETLTGTIAAGDVLVLANSQADATILAETDLISGTINHNGDDGYILRKNGEVIDSFGEIGVDPGSAWTGGGLSTANRTLLRKDSVTTGDIVIDDAFDPSVEYTGLANDDFSNLGMFGDGPVIEPPVEPTITLVSAIQGSGDETPLAGETVTIEVVVTADYQDGLFGSQGDLNGFFVQEELSDYDADALTSEGIFVFDGFDAGRTDVAVGDKVQITGTVSEFFGKTQISATTVAVVGTEIVPDAVEVEFGPNMSPNLEAVESMVVTIGEMVVTEMFNLDRFGQISVSDERFAQFTQNNDPDVAGFAAHVADVESRTIILDDGRSTQNPFEIYLPDGDDYQLTSTDSFRMGDTLQNITGVLDFSFGEYRVQTPTADYVPSNPRPDEAPVLEGNFKVASLNVLNYFTTLDANGAVTTVGQGPRGAENAEELARQQTKIVNAIVEMDVDVLGLIEIENDVASAPLATLTAAVNAALGAEVYGFINTGQVGTDAITNAIMYKIDTANPIGVTDILDGDFFVDPLDSPRDGLNRPAVTQSFEHIQTGEVLTVSVNHFKSKGSLSGLLEDEAAGDGQGNNNATRTEASKVLADHLATDPTGVGDGDTLIIGDLNAYAQEDPVTMLESKGYTDLAYDALGEDAYSYVFDGQIGTLDYIMSTAGLLDNVTGVAEWHINADEADAIDYNNEVFGSARDPSIFDGTTAARNSDHDPVIVAFQFERAFELISGTGRNDRIRGTEADERIESEGGRLDQMWGGGGIDQFVFGSETTNGRRERDLVRDYEAGVDQIVLAEGTEIASVRESRAGVTLTFEGDGDRATIFGRNLSFEDLDIVTEDAFVFT